MVTQRPSERAGDIARSFGANLKVGRNHMRWASDLKSYPVLSDKRSLSNRKKGERKLVTDVQKVCQDAGPPGQEGGTVDGHAE